MSRKHKKWNQQQHHPKDAVSPSDPSNCASDMVYTVRIEPDAKAEERYAEERRYRGDQLDTAKHLNTISSIAAGIAFLALIGLAIYVCETHKTNRLTEKALAQVKEQFVKDQRPYVWITNDRGSFMRAPQSSRNPSDKLAFNISFTNYGKSPAVHVQSDMKIAIGQDGWKKIVWKSFKPDEGSITPPGKIDGNTAFSDEPISPEFFSKVSSQGIMEPVEVLGHIQYWGTDGTSYYSDFCLGRNPTGGFYYCPYHNELN